MHLAPAWATTPTMSQAMPGYSHTNPGPPTRPWPILASSLTPGQCPCWGWGCSGAPGCPAPGCRVRQALAARPGHHSPGEPPVPLAQEAALPWWFPVVPFLIYCPRNGDWHPFPFKGELQKHSSTNYFNVLSDAYTDDDIKISFFKF